MPKLRPLILRIILGVAFVTRWATSQISGFGGTQTPVILDPEEPSIQGIEGFASNLQCFVSTCLGSDQKVSWYKNNELIAEGTTPLKDKLIVKHSVELSNVCSKSCARSDISCESYESCRANDSLCCTCSREEFSLMITRLNYSDSGQYKCQLQRGNSISIKLLVVEGGTFPSFGENLTFDYTECCRKNEISDTCLPMCKPSTIEAPKFDPMPCHKEFGKLLQCATDNGNVSHVHCCRLRLVPGFCWDYCSGRSMDFSKANRLCVYWMPEIFQCYEHAYLPYSGQPEQLVVNTVNDTALEACWDEPELRPDTVQYYTVNYQEVPQFSFFAGGLSLPVMPLPKNQPVRGNRARTSTISGQLKSKEDLSKRRKKRQTLFISTHNYQTNETDVREYKYKSVNTTDTCLTIGDLKAGTQYFVYVTATNQYGTSFPSIRETASTAEIAYANDSLPDVMSCCLKRGVDDHCAAKMCDLSKPPGFGSAFDLAFNCRKEFPKLSPCLADNRDHTECCREKGVYGDCLRFCDGSATELGLSSILCLTLDIQSIFACYRRGYVTLPSTPTNVTATQILSTSATISWDPPAVNPQLVKNYSLIYGSLPNSEIEVRDVKSPYTIDNLRLDTAYYVYLIARAEKGSSLRSTKLSFITLEPTDNVCQFGKPLLDGTGRPMRCGSRLKCPTSHRCVAARTDDPNMKFCCPLDIPSPIGPTNRIETPNATDCCINKGISGECLKLCTYKVSQDDLEATGINCLEHMTAYLECGNDGRNDVPCCQSNGISNDMCLDFCAPPLKRPVLDYVDCLEYTDKIVSCALDGALYLPGRPWNLTIEDQGADWFTIRWKKPEQPVTISNFELIINNSSMTNTSGLSLTVSGLKTNDEYEVRIVSWNMRGSSLPSDPVVASLRASAKLSVNDYKPRPPYMLRKEWYKDGVANVTWDWDRLSVNGKPIPPAEFTFYYIDHPNGFRSGFTWSNITTRDKFVLMPSLVTNKSYDVRVKAFNREKGVEGLYSEMNVVKAIENDQTASVDIWTDPSGYIKEGDMVTVHCVAKHSSPNRMVAIIHGDKDLAHEIVSATYTFKSIKVEDGFKPVMCVANIGGQIIRKKETLKIRYSPVIDDSSSSPLMVKGLQELPTFMHCVLHGFPTPKPEWFYQHDEMAPMNHLFRDENFIIDFKFDEDVQNAFDLTLNIEKSKTSNNGLYTCKACNELGCANRTLKLIVEPMEVPYGPEELIDCCKQRHVKPQCMSICGSEYIRREFEEEEDCAADFYKYFACSKSALDSKACCIGRNVPNECLDFCDTGFLAKANAALGRNTDKCNEHHAQIIDCMFDDRDRYLPPESVIKNVSALPDGQFKVSWQPTVQVADEGDTQNAYILYYKSSRDSNYTQVGSHDTFVLLRNLRPNVDYNFTVLAKNSYGFSGFSEPRSFNFAPLVAAQKAASDHSSGLIFGIIFILLLISAVIFSFIYFSRRPEKVPSAFLKIFRRNHPAANGAVAFENPGYGSDGLVRGLPGDPVIPPTNIGAHSGTGFSNGGGFESAQLETPSVVHEDAGDRQGTKGMKYEQLIS